jgi:DNA-directed RNA polymerase beta' subunit
MQSSAHQAQAAVHTDFMRKQLISQATVTADTTRTKAIAGIAFGMMTGAEMIRAAHIQVCSKELYQMPTRQPAPYGVLDPHLGVSNKNDDCATCGKTLAECAGHWGYIALELPVYHIGFLKETLTLLQAICKVCSRVLVDAAERKTLLRQMRDPKNDALRKARIRKRVIDRAKKVRNQPTDVLFASLQLMTDCFVVSVSSSSCSKRIVRGAVPQMGL